MNTALVLGAMLLPVLTGASLPLFRFKARRFREWYVILSVVLTSLLLLAVLLGGTAQSVTLLKLTQDFSISFRTDGLSKVFLGLIAFLWPLATVYAFEYIQHEGMEDKFFSFYTITYGITIGVASSANLITLYLFYELLTFATIPLIMHAMSKRAINASKKYLAYSVGGASMAFIGIVILYASGNRNLDFVNGGFVGLGSGDNTMLYLAYMMMFLGFGVKSAVVPLHGWLPAAGVAPTPVTALLHAVAVVKAGVFAIMRTTYYCFGPDVLRGTWVQYVTMGLAIITILYGSAMALKEQHIKRRLAFSTISNLSYILFGVTLMNSAGFAGAMAHMVFHGLMKITLFLCAGAIMYQTHKEYVPELYGFGKKMPVTFLTFSVGSLALFGIPLLPGFISKWMLATAAMEAGSIVAYLGIGALLLSAALTAGYLLPVVVKAYAPGADFQLESVQSVKDPNWYMKAPLVILCIAMFILGLNSNVLTQLLEQIAAGLL